MCGEIRPSWFVLQSQIKKEIGGGKIVEHCGWMAPGWQHTQTHLYQHNCGDDFCRFLPFEQQARMIHPSITKSQKKSNGQSPNWGVDNDKQKED